MVDNAKPPGADAPELNETAAALARGRELVRRAEESAQAAGQQLEDANAAAQQTEETLDRAQQLIDQIPSE